MSGGEKIVVIVSALICFVLTLTLVIAHDLADRRLDIIVQNPDLASHLSEFSW